MTVTEFIAKWSASGAAERANKDSFLIDLCDLLGVPRPHATTGDPDKDTYTFERDAVFAHEGDKFTTGKIDLFKDGHFILEAKQGSEETSKKLGSAKRNTPAWSIAMRDAYGQALGYARTFDTPPPFLITCDIGYCFDLYATFDGSWDYRPFPSAQKSRLFVTDLETHLDLLRTIFANPFSLDPTLRSAKVTREVATHLAALARDLEGAGHPPESVATFLMRSIFTMFAEDVGLLPERLFSKGLDEIWIPHPEKFPADIEFLWQAMNHGKEFGFVGKLLRFNGGLFSTPASLPLTKEHLLLLKEAALCDWADVEPAIFGTLLERALDPKERHNLGAHYTPRSYVERLVRPTIEEPLRADWDVVQAEVRQLVLNGKVPDAVRAVRAFHHRLCHLRVLDPACGSGNFLYVTLDLFKRLESEVLGLLNDLQANAATFLEVEGVSVTPAQFLGLEVKPWAREIADLVLWIGYLQWHFRTHGTTPPREPVLHDYKNIECRDAVLAYDSEELITDETTGKPVTRWDGFTTKTSPVTGEQIPDESATIPLYRYVNPRKAEWPEADFIVGNPPFVGNKKMRDALGDGYVRALRRAHADVPGNVDYVMYWWHHAAGLLAKGQIRRFGLITTNSITQSSSRAVLQTAMTGDPPVSIVFAVPDHPWVDSEGGAAVRIAMTVGEVGAPKGGALWTVEKETPIDEAEDHIAFSARRGLIRADLTVGAAVSSAVRLSANDGLSFMGVTLVGDGFRLAPKELLDLGFSSEALPAFVRRYLTTKDLTQAGGERFVIDFFGWGSDDAARIGAAAYQRLLDRVWPERAQNQRDAYRIKWWIFGEPRSKMRIALRGLRRFMVTPETSKHRFFVFLTEDFLADHSLFVIASEDAALLGVLSSRPHTIWALAAGSKMGFGNDPRYRNVTCFEPFPFPSLTPSTTENIRLLGDLLDAHRKRQQSLFPKLTLTAIYNVLEKLRSGEPLDEKERDVHDKGLVSVLKKIHDDLDAAVFDAYGWPHDLTDEQILERLVALNKQRAEEESKGVIRWLRPEFQDPGAAKPEVQTELRGTAVEEEGLPVGAKSASKTGWPKKLPDQIVKVRETLEDSKRSLSAAEGAKLFKGAKLAEVEAVLESLSSLGLVLSFEAGGVRRWRAGTR
jgi:hypothetical protein